MTETRLAILLQELHPTKNAGLDITKLSKWSHKRVFWLDEQGHEWDTMFYSRLQLNSNCPTCTLGLIKLNPETRLSVVRPDIAHFWHKSKNDSATPDDYTTSSSVVKWWECENGHEWPQKINSLCRRKTLFCLYCRNEKPKKMALFPMCSAQETRTAEDA